MRILAIGAISLALAALGIRLLRLARRSGGPERWLGVAFLAAGAAAFLLPVAALEALSPATARAIALAAQGGFSLAIASLVVFAWRVFRADSRIAMHAATALVAGNLFAGAAVIGAGLPVPTGALGLAVILTRCTALVWLFAESALYARQMRRRVRLGLADPVLADRFALWSIWTGALAFVPLFVLAMRAAGLLEAPAPGAPLSPGIRAVLAAVALSGGAAVAAGWLAFFPPHAYRRWIVRRSPTSH